MEKLFTMERLSICNGNAVYLPLWPILILLLLEGLCNVGQLSESLPRPVPMQPSVLQSLSEATKSLQSLSDR